VDTGGVEVEFERSLHLTDARGGDRYLRVTWHADASTIVLSQWRDAICVASTPLTLEDATRLIGLVVGALKEKAILTIGAATAEPVTGRNLLTRLRDRFRPQLAHIIRLPERGRASGERSANRNA
jgi:hypothetical protein